MKLIEKKFRKMHTDQWKKVMLDEKRSILMRKQTKVKDIIKGLNDTIGAVQSTQSTRY